MAARNNIAIAGSFIADSGGSLYNRAFFIEPSGEETFADKRHLFTMAGEHNSFSYGRDRLAVRFRGWNIAVVVCYDIRFPVWCRNVQNEYDLLIAVANWPKVRVNAWNQLLIARAIENEAYVCGVDCSGTDNNGFEYDGSSMAVDFKGKDISVERDSQESDPGTRILYANLSKEKLEAFRSKFPRGGMPMHSSFFERLNFVYQTSSYLLSYNHNGFKNLHINQKHLSSCISRHIHFRFVQERQSQRC